MARDLTRYQVVLILFLKGVQLMSARNWKIVRFYQDPAIPARTIRRRVTLEEAREWCRDPETSYSTCRLARGKDRTRRLGPWFDGYTEE